MPRWCVQGAPRSPARRPQGKAGRARGALAERELVGRDITGGERVPGHRHGEGLGLRQRSARDPRYARGTPASITMRRDEIQVVSRDVLIRPDGLPARCAGRLLDHRQLEPVEQRCLVDKTVRDERPVRAAQLPEPSWHERFLRSEDSHARRAQICANKNALLPFRQQCTSE